MKSRKCIIVSDSEGEGDCETGDKYAEVAHNVAVGQALKLFQRLAMESGRKIREGIGRRSRSETIDVFWKPARR
jgi:hypothetical protein